MLLHNLCEGLKRHGYQINIYPEKNRIYINGHKDFNEYITLEDNGHISLKVFLKTKQPGEKWSPEEYQKNKARKSSLIDLINGMDLGFRLDNNGEKV